MLIDENHIFSLFQRRLYLTPTIAPGTLSRGRCVGASSSTPTPTLRPGPYDKCREIRVNKCEISFILISNISTFQILNRKSFPP